VHVGQAAALAAAVQPGPALAAAAEANPLLTPRQARILHLVADGQSDRGIARTLGISTRTVQAHLQRTYRALDVTSRTEAVARLRVLDAAPSLSRSGRRVRW
jgi:LuxR family maltose regulon positive regulatory protein